jgi:hypothetical protein
MRFMVIERFKDRDAKAIYTRFKEKGRMMPELADRVADDIYVKRSSLAAAAKSLPIGNRTELGRWRGEVRRVLAEVVA